MRPLARSAILFVAALASCQFKLDRSLSPGDLMGRLVVLNATGQPQPVAGAHVTLDGSRYEVVSDANGRFGFHSLAAGNFTLRISRDSGNGTFSTVLVLPDLVLPQVAGHADALDLGDVPIAALGGLQGSVTRNGEPVSGAQVVVSGLDQTIAPMGSFSFDALPPGTYELFVVDPQSQLYSDAQGKGVKVTVQPRNVANVTLALDAMVMATPGNVTGQVQAQETAGFSPTAAAGTTVTFSGGPSPISFTTDSSGHYSGTVPPGVYSVVAHKQGNADDALPSFVVAGTSLVPDLLLIPLTGDPCAPAQSGDAPGPCSIHATCTAQAGAAVCTCQTGYVGDGYTCAGSSTATTGCGPNNGGCDTNATCSLSGGQPVCTCNQGFQGNGMTCTAMSNGTNLTVKGDMSNGFGTEQVTFAACSSAGIAFPIPWQASATFQPLHAVEAYVSGQEAIIADLYGNVYFDSNSLSLTLSQQSGTLPSIALAGGSFYDPNTQMDVYVPGMITLSGNYTCTPAKVPGAPSNVTAMVQQGQVMVAWQPPASDGGAPITGYTITAMPGGLQTMAYPSQPYAQIIGLTSGTSYTFTVTATNAVGTGPASSASNAITAPAVTVPGAPTDVMATAANGYVMVFWSPPLDDGGSSITGYLVAAMPGGTTTMVMGSQTYANVEGLANGTSYTFTVAAINAQGTGAASVPSNAVMPANPPDAPTNLMATPGDQQVSLSWSAPANDGGSPILAYTVTVTPGLMQIMTAGDTTTVVTGLQDGVTYTFTVHATNNIGDSPESTAVTATPSAGPTVPDAPVNVSATAAYQSASVMWQPPMNDGGSPITGYVVTASPGGMTASTTGATTVVVSGLTNGTSYTFTVTATNMVGTSQPSMPSNAVVPYDPPSAMNSSIVPLYTSVNADGRSATSITITVRDAMSLPLAGVLVTLSSSGTANQFAPPGGKTDANGQLTVLMRSFHPEVKNVTATVEGVSVSTSVTFQSIVCSGGTTFLSPDYEFVGAPEVAFQEVHGDFNNDGHQDLATSSTNGTGGAVSVLINKGDGTYKPGVNYAVGLRPTGLVVNDFNKDGAADLISMNADSMSLSVLLGNGDGTFKPATTISSSVGSQLVTADFNMDTKPDLAIVGTNVVILLGNGDGTFQAPVTTTVASSANQIAVGDINGDSIPDMAVAAAYYNAPVYLGKGDGTFQAAKDNGFSGTPNWVALGNFNADTRLDMVVLVGGMLNVMLGNGDGTFQTPVPYAAGNQSSEMVVVTDLTADGNQDLITADSAATVSLMVGNGDGTFGAPQTYPTGVVAARVDVADFNSDTFLDVAVVDADANPNVAILLGGRGLYAPPTYSTGAMTNPEGVAAGDLNGDGAPDLVVTDYTSNTASVLMNNGTGVFGAPTPYTVGLSPGAVAIADFNGDAKNDAAVVNGGSVNVSILMGNVDGTLQTATSASLSSYPTDIVTADFNGDGNVDLAVSEFGGASVAVLLGNGDGTFQASVDYYAGQYPNMLVVEDINGDGKMDLAVANYDSSGQYSSILLGNGDGSFQMPLYIAMGTGNALTVADFDGDGKADVAVVSPGSTTDVSIFKGSGDGTFGPPTQYGVNSNPTWIVSGDINGDGKIDLILQGGASDVNVIYGNGDGTFQAATTLGYVTADSLSQASLILADFNGDGRVDVAGVDSTANAVPIMLNRCVTPVSF